MITAADGDVPDGIASLVGEPDGYLLYRDDRGQWSQQFVHRIGEGIVGGWDMERVGRCRVVDGVVVDPLPTEEHEST